MGYSLSYAGVPLPISSPELESHLARLLPPQDFDSLSLWNYAGFNLGQLPTPDLPKFPPLEPGVLRWPTGACRPACCYLVVNGTKLAEIRTAVSDPMTAQPLVLSDSRDGFSVTASMYLLPPRPLNQVYGGTNAADGWLLTLVDRRFYDMFRRGVVTQPVSWTDLFEQLGTILGTTITVDTVASAYGTPSSKWVQEYQPTCAMLDAAAAQVGQVVVYGLDGTISTRNYTTAKTDSDTQIDDVVAQVGGFVLDADIARYVPEAVDVVFGLSTDTSTTHVESVPLVGLSITEYGASVGVAGTQGTTFADLLYDGSNSVAVTSYAIQAATDWYGWRLPNLDVSVPGIYPWVPTGWEDAVEWRYQVREDGPYADTRIRRGEWDVLPAGNWWAGIVPIPSNWIPSGGSGSGSGSGGGCSEAVTPVEVMCENGIRTITTSSIAVGISNNQLVLEVCDEEVTDLGPCSPVTPGGTTLPVATKVCPIYAGCVVVTTDYTITNDDAKIVVDASGGPITLTLPPWIVPDVWFTIVVVDDTNTITVAAAVSENINGNPTYVLTGAYSVWQIEALCTGDWVIQGPMGEQGPVGPTGATGPTGAGVITGQVIMWAAAGAPAGWLTCNGAAVSRTTYADLFDAVGETWGVGDGSTTFNLPDFRSRSPLGAGTGSGLTARALAETGGEEDHTLTVAEMPAHTHSYTRPVAGNEALNLITPGVTSTAAATTGSTGGGATHNTMHPWIGINFVIKT